MQRIIFVDDEPFLSQGYVEALKNRFQVDFLVGARDAMNFMRRHGEAIRAAIVDAMMPTPDDAEDHETADGFETGLWLLARVQAELPKIWPIPTVILTNRSTTLVADALRRREIVGDMIEIRRKLETPAFALPKIVQARIDRPVG